MNLAFEIRPSPSLGGRPPPTAPARRSSRRLSSLILNMKKKIEEDDDEEVELECKSTDGQEHLAEKHIDSAEDMAIVETFQPKRQYIAGQRRRSSMQFAKTLGRFGSPSSSSPPVSPEKEGVALSPFERQRKEHQNEEGTQYEASRATDKAARSCISHTSGPLGLLVQDDEEEDTTPADWKCLRRRSSLLELLDKDAMRVNSTISIVGVDNQSRRSETINKRDAKARVPEEEKKEDAGGDSLTYVISSQAEKEQKLRDVFKRQKEANIRRELNEGNSTNNDEATIVTISSEQSAGEETSESGEPKEEAPPPPPAVAVIMNADGSGFTLLQYQQAERLKRDGLINDRHFTREPTQEELENALEDPDETKRKKSSKKKKRHKSMLPEKGEPPAQIIRRTRSSGTGLAENMTVLSQRESRTVSDEVLNEMAASPVDRDLEPEIERRAAKKEKEAKKKRSSSRKKKRQKSMPGGSGSSQVKVKPAEIAGEAKPEPLRRTKSSGAVLSQRGSRTCGDKAVKEGLQSSQDLPVGVAADPMIDPTMKAAKDSKKKRSSSRKKKRQKSMPGGSGSSQVIVKPTEADAEAASKESNDGIQGEPPAQMVRRTQSSGAVLSQRGRRTCAEEVLEEESVSPQDAQAGVSTDPKMDPMMKAEKYVKKKRSSSRKKKSQKSMLDGSGSSQVKVKPTEMDAEAKPEPLRRTKSSGAVLSQRGSRTCGDEAVKEMATSQEDKQAAGTKTAPNADPLPVKKDAKKKRSSKMKCQSSNHAKVKPTEMETEGKAESASEASEIVAKKEPPAQIVRRTQSSGAVLSQRGRHTCAEELLKEDSVSPQDAPAGVATDSKADPAPVKKDGKKKTNSKKKRQKLLPASAASGASGKLGSTDADTRTEGKAEDTSKTTEVGIKRDPPAEIGCQTQASGAILSEGGSCAEVVLMEMPASSQNIQASATTEPVIGALATERGGENDGERGARQTANLQISDSAEVDREAKAEGVRSEAMENRLKKEPPAKMMRRTQSSGAVLAQRGASAKEAVKETSARPTRTSGDASTLSERDPVLRLGRAWRNKRISKLTRGVDRRTSCPAVQRRASLASPPSSCKKSKSSRKKKGSLHASMPDLSAAEKEGYYDWALAAKRQKKNARITRGEGKLIKSDADCARKPAAEGEVAQKPSSSTCLPPQSAADAVRKLRKGKVLVKPTKNALHADDDDQTTMTTCTTETKRTANKGIPAAKAKSKSETKTAKGSEASSAACLPTKSVAGAVQKPPDGEVVLKPSNDTSSTTGTCLPQVKALWPRLEPKLREETMDSGAVQDPKKRRQVRRASSTSLLVLSLRAAIESNKQ